MLTKFSLLGRYFISTRLKYKGNKIAFLLFYLFPIALITYSYSYSYIYDLYKVVLVIGLTYSIYELGYIYNDTITIRKEAEPTLRLSKIELSFFNSNIKKILAIRAITFFTLMMLYIALGVNVTELVLLVVLFVTFYIYNNVRSKLNLPLHFILVSLRYLIPLIHIFEQVGCFELLFILMLYPILNTLERASEKRFSYIPADFFLVEYKKNGRIYYYAISLILSSVYSYFFNVDAFVFVVIFSAMLLARIMARLVMKYERYI